MDQDKRDNELGSSPHAQHINLEDQSDGGTENRLSLDIPALPAPISTQATALAFLGDNHIDEDKQWKLMMDYFKKNPTALMDAIPTPREDEQDPEFRTGLTPKKGFSFKFGDAGPNRPETANRPGSAQRRGSAMSRRSITPGR